MGRLGDALKGVTLSKETQQLVAKADNLLDREVEQASYIQHMEAEIERLREEKGISGTSDGLSFNTATGTNVDSAGVHYCTKCLLSNDKRSPLKNEAHGWKCMVCGKFFRDPARPYPTTASGGGGHWMD